MLQVPEAHLAAASRPVPTQPSTCLLQTQAPAKQATPGERQVSQEAAWCRQAPGLAGPQAQRGGWFLTCGRAHLVLCHPESFLETGEEPAAWKAGAGHGQSRGQVRTEEPCRPENRLPASIPHAATALPTTARGSGLIRASPAPSVPGPHPATCQSGPGRSPRLREGVQRRAAGLVWVEPKEPSPSSFPPPGQTPPLPGTHQTPS